MNEKLYELLDVVQRTAAQAGCMAADAAYGVGKKANELLSTAKLNIKIMELKGNVKTAMQELGQLLYATHTGNPTDSEILLAKLEEVDALYAKIAEYDEQLGKEPAAPVCGTCGAALQEGAAFCGECGEKLEDQCLRRV